MSGEPTDHELARTAPVERLLHQLAQEPVQPRRSLTDRTLRALRSEQGLLTTSVGARGTDRISEAAVARAIAREVRTIEGVRHATVRLQMGDGLRARVELVAALGAPLVPITQAARAVAAEVVERTTGRAPDAVDVHVDDLA